MDLKTTDEGEEVVETKEEEEGALKLSRSLSNKDTLVRADQIDLKNFDMQLEKQLTRGGFSVSRLREGEAHVKEEEEEWEIDLAKLDIRNVIAHGTYGTVYRGVYDGLDVAGN